MLYHEADMSETIDIWQFIPIRRVSVIDVQWHRLTDLITTTSYDHE